MIYIFFAGLVLISTISIIIIKEFTKVFYEIALLNKELDKYSAKNKYYIRKTLSTIKQSKKIIVSTKSIEEKIHWLLIMVESLNKIKIYIPNDLTSKVEKHEEKCKKELKRLESKLNGDDDFKKLPKLQENSGDSSSSSNVA